MTRESNAFPFPGGSAERRSTGRRRHRPQPILDWLAAIHATVLLVAASWAFGGQADWVRGPLTAWGSAGALITLAAVLKGRSSSDGSRIALWWACPLLAVNAVVLIAARNPSFRPIHFGTETYLANVGGREGWPSSALPSLARRALWELDAIWISAFNLALVVRRRKTLRGVLIVAAVNAAVLAIFGTAQKLVGARGIFFGLYPSPQKYFFASFVYHNHWGAFMLLIIAVAVALTRYYAQRSQARDVFHSPAVAGVVAILFLAASIPLSASRSCTILATLFLIGAAIHLSLHVIRRRQYYHESAVLPVAAVIVAVVAAFSAAGYLARDTIRTRVALTYQQIQHARSTSAPDARVELYQDTMHMAEAKRWFGWGMASYPHVFTLYNTRQAPDGFPVFYHDAHSDWLQSLAEHGVIGTLLLAATALVPLAALGRKMWNNGFSAYLVFGCSLIVIYSAVEFPFGNFAIVLTWWICFWIAVQYARLTAEKRAAAASYPSLSSP